MWWWHFDISISTEKKLFAGQLIDVQRPSRDGLQLLALVLIVYEWYNSNNLNDHGIIIFWLTAFVNVFDQYGWFISRRSKITLGAYVSVATYSLRVGPQYKTNEGSIKYRRTEIKPAHMTEHLFRSFTAILFALDTYTATTAVFNNCAGTRGITSESTFIYISGSNKNTRGTKHPSMRL